MASLISPLLRPQASQVAMCAPHALDYAESAVSTSLASIIQTSHALTHTRRGIGRSLCPSLLWQRSHKTSTQFILATRQPKSSPGAQDIRAAHDATGFGRLLRSWLYGCSRRIVCDMPGVFRATADKGRISSRGFFWAGGQACAQPNFPGTARAAL